MAEEEKKKTNWLKFIFRLIILIIVLVIVIAIISAIFNFSIAGVSMRERIHNIYVRTIIHWINYAKTNLGFMAPFFKGADILLGGKEDVFSWEETGEVKEKTGVEISELTPFGLDSKGDFGGDANIIVYKFDESIKELKVFVSCELKAPEGDFDGDIRSSRVRKLDGGEFVIIENYRGRDKEEIPIRCVFPFDKRGVIRPTLVFNVIYSLPNEAKLDTFVVPIRVFGEYEDKLDLAFKELNNGVYKDYKSMITSTRDYDSDVKTVMFFERQPLNGVNNRLYFQFKNDNTENKINVKSFKIELPEGMTLDCPYTNFENSVFLNDLDEQLNNEDRISEKFECSVNVNEDVFGGSKADILKVYPPIIGKLDYNNVLKKEVALKFK